jgi:hypothetical protein
MDEKLTARQVNRRRLLRGAGTVAVGVAGAGVASAVVATPASADAPTTFTSTDISAPAVVAVNSATSTEGTDTTIGPQIQLTPTVGDIISSSAPKGSLAMDDNGTIWAVTDVLSGSGVRDFIFTTGNSSSTWPVSPKRILDTDSTTATGRHRILNQSGAFTGNRFVKLRWNYLDLTDFVRFGFGVIAVVQAVTPTTSGYIAIGPYNTSTSKPTFSQLNFTPGPTCNTLIYSGIDGRINTPGLTTDMVKIWCSAEVRVVFDIFAFTVDSLSRIVEFAGGAGLQASEAASFAAQRQAFIAQHAPRV